MEVNLEYYGIQNSILECKSIQVKIGISDLKHSKFLVLCEKNTYLLNVYL